MTGRLILFFFSCLVFSACGENSAPAADQGLQPESFTSTRSDSSLESEQTKSDSLNRRITKTATSIYDWYIPLTNENYNDVPTRPSVVKDVNGKCKLDFEPYFNELRKLGTISEKYLQTERERTEGCATYMATISWEEYTAAEAYQYDDRCQEFYYMHLTNGQETYSGVIVDKIERQGSKYLVKLAFYYNGEKRIFDRTNQPLVTVESEDGIWKITQIDWILHR
jgi:hypothetical protein